MLSPPEGGFDPLAHREVRQVEISVGEGKHIAVVAYGDMAERFDAVRLGARVVVTGPMIGQQWKTGDKKKHCRIVVETETLDVIEEKTPCRNR